MRTKKTKKKTYKRYAATMNEIDTYLTIDGFALKDERLKDFNVKALYSRIKMYVNLRSNGSCFATNKTLSKYIGKSPSWIKEKIALLKKLKYIYEDGINGRERHLKLCKESEYTQPKISPHPAKNWLGVPILPLKEDLKVIKENTHEMNFMDTFSKKISKKPYEQKHFNLSCKLLNLQQKIRPKMLRQVTPSIKINGALEIKRLERIDKYDFKKEIKPSILWSVHDSFWGRNIISAASIRNKGKNGLTKFQNMFNHYLESIEKETSNSDVPVKDRKIIDMIQKDYHPFSDTQLLLTIPKMRKAYKETKTAPGELTDFITFIWEYIKYLKKQEWITDPHPSLFRSDGKVWGKFIDDLKENKMIM